MRIVVVGSLATFMGVLLVFSFLIIIGTVVLLGLLHELGHVGVGYMVGLRLRLVGFGPWDFYLQRPVVRAPGVKHPGLLRVYMQPKTPDHLRIRNSLWVAAGPLANIALSAACAAALWKAHMGDAALYLLLWLASSPVRSASST